MNRFLFFGALFCSLIASAQTTGIAFPDLKGESLSDKTINVPSDTKGKYTILCLAWSEDSEEELKTWLQPAYDKYIAKDGLMDDAFDVNLYFVPMFTGAKTAAYESSKKKFKKETQADLQSSVLFYKGDIDGYKTALKMTDSKKPYIFLLDTTGKIIYATSGEYTEDKLDALDDKIQ